MSRKPERVESGPDPPYDEPMLRSHLLALPLLLTGCNAPKEPAPLERPLALRTHWSLPDDWDTMPPFAFEELCLRELPEDVSVPFAPEAGETLRQALDRMDLSSVRAAVLLGRSRHAANASILIRRLEKREVGPKRNSDSGDCVAAASLARFPDPARFAQRLVPLAIGPDAHPDLEVRVECAVTALYAGFTEVIPFLLQVIRIDTYDGHADARDFPITRTSAWPRGRAAEALSLYAGVPLTYRIDGPIALREEEARKLEALLKSALEEDPETQGSTR